MGAYKLEVCFSNFDWYIDRFSYRSIFIKIFISRYCPLINLWNCYFFVILQLQGYSNKKINTKPIKILAGGLSGVINGLGTLGGMPISLLMLITRVSPIVIRGSLAAIFFIADAYVLNLSFFSGIVDSKVFYRALPLILILPIGVFIGNKFFIRSKEETYRKFVFYFLIIISIIGIIKVLNNF